MAAKICISFALLALFVAVSMQMPDYEARSRVRREDKPAKETVETAEAPDVKGEENVNVQTGGVEINETGAPSSSSGGGFPNIGEGIPGQDIFKKYIESFTQKESPTAFIEQFKSIFNQFSGGPKQA